NLIKCYCDAIIPSFKDIEAVKFFLMLEVLFTIINTHILINPYYLDNIWNKVIILLLKSIRFKRLSAWLKGITLINKHKYTLNIILSNDFNHQRLNEEQLIVFSKKHIKNRKAQTLSFNEWLVGITDGNENDKGCFSIYTNKKKNKELRFQISQSKVNIK